MKCPHCRVAFNDEQSLKQAFAEKDVDHIWRIQRRLCPDCHRLILTLEKRTRTNALISEHFIVPKASARICSNEVPNEYKEDFTEAALVLADSPKASAALTRRCLQHLLREEVKTKKKDLFDQIDEVVSGSLLPSYLCDDLDAVRNIGNFAAHPIKSQQTGEILPVEPGEAEWNLDVLEALFDFLFVQPAKNQKRKDALNSKLQEAGKPVLQ